MPLRRPPWRRAAVLLLFLAAGCGPNASTTAPAPDRSPRAEAFLDTLQRRTFDFFWERSDPATGLTPDRWPSESFSSIAAVGYALTAYGIGAEEGYVSRADAAGRVLTTLKWFWQAPQGPAPAGTSGYQGFFYHFLDMRQGHRFRDVELSTIDTALLLAGVLFCQSYFDGSAPVEGEIRALADSLYRRTNWQWAQRTPPLVNMGWKPESGWELYDWNGFNEAMLLYILALGSPTFPLDRTAWSKWSSTYQWGTFYGQAHVGFAPLFGHHYSHVWIDFRGIQDPYMRARGIDYFENSRRATLSQRSYAIDNPHDWAGYGATTWGLSASDGPADARLEYRGSERQFFTYAARGASFNEVRDDGTIAPTAAAGSLPFAPEVVIPALLSMRTRFGDYLFGQYGFFDAFNPSFTFDVPVAQGRKVPGRGWFDTDYLGIDQGPIVAMIANYRKDLVWKTMRRNPYIVTGLKRAGFTGGWLAH
jgi:hypothetical protein